MPTPGITRSWPIGGPARIAVARPNVTAFGVGWGQKWLSVVELQQLDFCYPNRLLSHAHAPMVRGCNSQAFGEEFWNCADIAVVPSGSTVSTTPSTTSVTCLQ